MKLVSMVTGDVFDNEAQEPPPRSHLYSLEPIGLGTGEVESATSYLARLAIAHAVSTWTLLKCEIAPRLFGLDANLRNRLSELLAAMGSACNGENNTSRKFISILGSLTGREDLVHTSMGFCRGFVAPRFLVRVKQAWCSSCLAEWKANGRLIYFPLLWHILAVTVCPRHRISLRTSCPACGRTFHPWTAHSRPGYSPRCGQWLGSAECGPAATASERAVELEIAQRASDFLRQGPGTLASVEKSAFPKNIELLLNCSFGKNIARLARFLGVHRYTINAWRSGVQRPTLLSLADLSLKVNVAMEALLGAQLRADEFTLKSGSAGQPGGRRFFSPPKSDLGRMRQVLEEAAKDDVSPSPSVSELASRLKCRQTTLARRFPELTRKIKDQYQQDYAIRKEVRAKLFRSLVRAAVIDLHESGYYPSQSRVRQVLPNFIDMREPVAYEAWRQAVAELNIPREKADRAAV